MNEEASNNSNRQILIVESGNRFERVMGANRMSHKYIADFNCLDGTLSKRKAQSHSSRLNRNCQHKLMFQPTSSTTEMIIILNRTSLSVIPG